MAAEIEMLRHSYKKFLALGDKAIGADFTMKIAEYPELEYLVQAVQIPKLGRELIEGFGPRGVKFNHQGRPENAGETTVTFVETLSGKLYTAIRDWVVNKRYLDVEITLGGDDMEGFGLTLRESWLVLDAADLSVEDATLVKPAGTLYYNWPSLFDSSGLAGNL
jgi:hypothetical protein